MNLILLPLAVLSLTLASPEILTPVQMELAPYQEIILKDQVQIGTVQLTRQNNAWNLSKGAIRYSKETILRLSRFGNPVTVRMVESEDRLAKGEIGAFSMRQFQGNRPLVNLQGTLAGNQMRVVIEGVREGLLPFELQTFGPLGKEFALSQREWKEGDKCVFNTYLPMVNRVVGINALAKKTTEMPQAVLLVEMVPEKITAGEQSLQLPGTTYYLGENRKVIATKTELDGIGEVLIVRNGREIPFKGGGETFDIGKAGLISLNRKIPAAKSSTKMVYRISSIAKGGSVPDLPSDSRQKVQVNLKGEVTLEVNAFRVPADVPSEPQPQDEEMIPSRFINWDQPAVRLMASNINKRELDPWRKSILLESLVRQRMQFDNQAELASASEIARQPKGDCRHAAILLAALLRAEGIPSRVVHGLVYVEKGGKPFMGFHMWTEAYARGTWFPLDGTIGLGFVGADHIKISHNTYSGVDSLAPMAVVQPFIGKIKLEID